MSEEILYRDEEIQLACQFAECLQQQPFIQEMFKRVGRIGLISESDRATIDYFTREFQDTHPDAIDAGYVGHAISMLRYFNDSLEAWDALDSDKAISHLRARERKIFYALKFTDALISDEGIFKIYKAANKNKPVPEKEAGILRRFRETFVARQSDATYYDLLLVSAGHQIAWKIITGDYPDSTDPRIPSYLSNLQTGSERADWGAYKLRRLGSRPH